MDQELVMRLHEIRAVKFGTFTLKSGIESPIYIDLRLIVSYPDLLQKVADAMWEKVKDCEFDLICGVPYTALPIATAMSVKQGVPMVMRRKEVKDYGTKKAIEGVYETGQKCLIVEDLVTSGSSVFETIVPLEQEGLKVTDIVVLINREQGGKEHITKKGYTLHTVFTISEMLDALHRAGKIDEQMLNKVTEFIGGVKV